MSSDQTKTVATDGGEALAYVILRATGTDNTVALEADMRDDVDERQAAQVLRHIADQWAPRPGLAGIFDEISVQRSRQRTAYGADETTLPDGTGQYPETIDADTTRMACDQAAEGGYLDWLHVVRTAAGQAYAESRPTELRPLLVELAAFTAGWIQAIDLRTSSHADGIATPLNTTEAPPADGTGTPPGDQ